MRKTFVLFPGAWGNLSRECVCFWFQEVKKYLNGKFPDSRIVALTYQGKSLADYAEFVLGQLQEILDDQDVTAIAYSMGGQILRLVAEARPKLFQRHVLICCSGPEGMPVVGFLKGVVVVPFPFIAGLFTGRLEFRNKDEIRRLLFNVDPDLSELVAKHAHAESFTACWELSMVGWRLQTTPLDPTKTTAIRARDDKLFSTSKLEGRTIEIPGGHGVIFDAAKIRPALDLIKG